MRGSVDNEFRCVDVGEQPRVSVLLQNDSGALREVAGTQCVQPGKPVPVQCAYRGNLIPTTVSPSGRFTHDGPFVPGNDVIKSCLSVFGSQQSIVEKVLLNSIAKRLDAYADQLNVEIDRHNLQVELEQILFEENIADIRTATEREVGRLVLEATEPPKKSMFG